MDAKSHSRGEVFIHEARNTGYRPSKSVRIRDHHYVADSGYCPGRNWLTRADMMLSCRRAKPDYHIGQ
ncbi:hypothetical protein Pcinc_033862 [Petrolisthes cinctipes]|uniref:Uncharacterized protein n=1 Tax=Petrolisthes cinctipes TaxID=88211 RepID=A0AAE1K0I4_PETCI|nr:hypothetical protein Pcinc_033862 [Petrolisthes cinctipes]